MSTYSLSGSGVQLLTADTTALHVSITTLSPFGGIGNANPANHYHQALLRPGDGAGFWAPVPVEGGPQWIGLPNGTDRIGYACEGGAVISVVEVIGGTSPFAGPPGSPGPAGTGFYVAYLCYKDQKAPGTNGGTATSGAWRTRDLTLEEADTGNHGTLAANQITLDAGTYDCIIRCPVYANLGMARHQARLQNITDSTTLLSGTNGFSAVNANDYSEIRGTFTLASAKTLEVQHRVENTVGTNGFGIAINASFAVDHEEYTVAQFWLRG